MSVSRDHGVRISEGLADFLVKAGVAREERTPRRRLIACYFTPQDRPEEGEHWARMARALRKTAELHCPGWDIEIEEIHPEPMESARKSRANATNSQKLRHWVDRVLAAADGQELLLMDVDAFIVGSLDEAFADPAFDLTYTVRPPGKAFPFNGGVLFLRVSANVRAFMHIWRRENDHMLADRRYHGPFYVKYGGINQAAFGKLLEDGIPHALGLNIRTLPCETWNCENTSWAAYEPGVTRIVHAKSALRRRIFGSPVTTTGVERLAMLWQEIEASVNV